MYDNIKLVYEKENDKSILSMNGFQTINSVGKNGSSYQMLCLKDFTVWEYPKHFTIQIPSLIRIFHGHSFEILTVSQAKTALEGILDLFNLDPQDLKVTNLEFGGNVELSNKVSSYIGYLEHLSRHKISNYKSETLKFTSNGRDFMFYDKLKKAKSKRFIDPIPEMYGNKNILRLELQIHKVAIKFKREIYVSDLIDQDFYSLVCEMWYDFFKEILTGKEICDNPLFDAKSKAEFIEILIGLGILHMGLDHVLLAYEHIKNNKVFGYTNKSNYYVFKGKLIEYNEHPSFKNPVLIDELNEKIRELYEKIRSESNLL